MNAVRGSIGAALCLLWGGHVALAHHDETAGYDSFRSVTVTGTVTAFRFTHPHALIYLEVESADGTRTVWSAGLASPELLTRNDDWTSDSLEAGDIVTVIGNPARNGAPSLRAEQVFDNIGRAMLSGP